MSQLLPVTNNGFALIDSRDYPRANTHTWWKDGKFPVTTVDKRKVSLGAYVLRIQYPDRAYYKDGDRFNCTRGNLTTKRGETKEGMAIEKIRQDLAELMGKVADVDLIAKAKAILADGDKEDLQKYTRILKKAR